MEQQKETQMVYIKDLLFTVLYRWKAVLAITLALALLLGGLPFLLGGAPSPEDTQKLESYNTAKAVYDQRISALEKSVAERQTHLAEALLMQLDPYNHYEAQLTISVRLQEETPGSGFSYAFSSQAVLEAYREVLTEETCLRQLAEILKQPAQYVPELLGSTSPAIGTDTMTFSIKCADAQTAAALADAVKAHLEQYKAQISTDVAQHDLSVLKSTALATADSSLAETQRTEIARLAEILTGLTEAQNKRNALVAPEKTSTAKTAVVLAVVGAVAGVFVMVCPLWIGHIGSGKVYSARTLQNRTGIKVLGTLNSGLKRGPVQKWLRKLEGRSSSTDPSVLATDIALRATQTKLLITGSGEEAIRKALAEALKKAMPQVQITEAACVLECPDALKALAACEAVVLVEGCGSSRYQQIRRQTEKFEDYGKQLIGCIVLDG